MKSIAVGTVAVAALLTLAGCETSGDGYGERYGRDVYDGPRSRGVVVLDRDYRDRDRDRDFSDGRRRYDRREADDARSRDARRDRDEDRRVESRRPDRPDGSRRPDRQDRPDRRDRDTRRQDNTACRFIPADDPRHDACIQRLNPY